MRTDQTKKDRGAGTAEHRLAAECKTLVISSAHGQPDRAGKIAAYIRDRGKDGRFDLLTTLEPARLAASGPLLDQLVADAKLAIQLHHGEQVVVAVYGDPVPILTALKRRKEFRDGGIEFHGLNLSRGAHGGAKSAATPTVAVTCMDFRQHDDSLDRKLAEAFGGDDLPAVLAMAGGAKDLADPHPRGRLVLDQLRLSRRRCAFKRIILTCHTDCGAFGGDSAPAFLDERDRPDAGRQRRTLEQHLRAAALTFRVAFPMADVMTGIVRVDAGTGRIAEILPIRA